MSKHTIVVCDHIHESGLKILASDPEVELVNAADEPKDVLLERYIPLADVAITRSSTDVDDKFLARPKSSRRWFVPAWGSTTSTSPAAPSSASSS